MLVRVPLNFNKKGIGDGMALNGVVYRRVSYVLCLKRALGFIFTVKITERKFYGKILPPRILRLISI